MSQTPSQSRRDGVRHTSVGHAVKCSRPPSWYALPLVLSASVLLACGLLTGKDSADDGSPAAATEAKAATDQEVSADAVELEYWSSIKESDHAEDFASYLERYPDGAFVDLAKNRVERLSYNPNTASPNAPIVGSLPAEAPPVQTPPAQAGAPSALVGGSPGGDLSAAPSRGPPGRRLERREDVIRDAVRSALRGYSDRRLHLAPNIPRRKLDNVADLHGLDPSRVILLYDDGSGGGGKTGFCLTDRRIYWRLIAGDSPYYLDYEDVQRVRVDRSGFTVNGYDISTTLANQPALAAERFADVIEEIRYRLRNR